MATLSDSMVKKIDDKLAAKLREIFNGGVCDSEITHSLADTAIAEAIEELGLKKTAESYREMRTKVPFWYS